MPVAVAVSLQVACGVGVGGAAGEGGVESVAVDDGVVALAQQGAVGQVGGSAVEPVP